MKVNVLDGALRIDAIFLDDLHAARAVDFADELLAMYIILRIVSHSLGVNSLTERT